MGKAPAVQAREHIVWIMRGHRIVGLPAIPASKGWDEMPRESWLARLASGWTEMPYLNNKNKKTTEGDF